MNSFYHQPRKRFGQHFLSDQRVITDLINVLAPRSGDVFVEIGPGMGALTLPLLQETKTLIAIELDKDIIPKLKAKAASYGELQLIESDILKVDLGSLYAGKPLRVVGNLPYNISSPILFHCLKSLNVIQDMHFMLQKEVVDRLCAAPGCKDYGRLSVMVQFFCGVQHCFDVPPESFDPPPKVDSSIVRLIPLNPPRSVNFKFEDFEQLVKLAFGQRRKTLRNTLQPLMTAEQIQAAGVNPQARAETLSVEEFIALTQKLL